MGIIYVLINEAMPELVKVGRIKTGGKTIEQRMRELDTTGVPLPFECYSAWEVDDDEKAERALHQAFEDHRVRQRREFFSMSPDRPTAILKAFGIKDVTPKGDVVSEEDGGEDDKRALDRERRKRSKNFSFKLAGIEPRAELESVFDENVKCVVQDSKRVIFKDTSMSLSAAALLVAHENGKEWISINGPLYWKYNGRTLTDLRNDPNLMDD